MKRDLVVLQLTSCLQKTNNKGLLCCTTKILIHDNLKEIRIWLTWSWQNCAMATIWSLGDNLIITAWKDPSPFFTWCGWKDYITTSITTLANKCPDFEIRNCLGCNSNMLYRMALHHALFISTSIACVHNFTSSELNDDCLEKGQISSFCLTCMCMRLQGSSIEKDSNLVWQ